MNNQQKIECEVRGPLTLNDFDKLRPELTAIYGPFTQFVELVIFFKYDSDVRLKINNKEARLVLKRKITGQQVKEEHEVPFPTSHVAQLIEILSNIGYKEGLFSFVERFDATKKGTTKSFSVKLGSRIGDFFEIEEIVTEEKLTSTAIKNAIDDAKKFGLKEWSEETYKQLIKTAWDGVEAEKLIVNGTLHPLILSTIQKIDQINSKFESRSTKDILSQKSNDYTAKEIEFAHKIKSGLLSLKKVSNRKINLTKRLSIIIPTYNSCKTIPYLLNSIEKQQLGNYSKDKLEIVLVDDGSTDATQKLFQNFKSKFKFTYIRQNHLGRSYARNLGASLARGDIFLFLDSDVVLEENFVFEHWVRHEFLDNSVFVSFKENVLERDIKKRLLNKVKPDISKDFRFTKTVNSDWKRQHRHVRFIEVGEIKLLERTANFKEFGFGKVVGVWDLPSMVVSCAVSVSAHDFHRIGGFNLQFKGWGMEDTYLGAMLIASGCYIIPVFSTGIFSIKHPPRSGSEGAKMKEFGKNVIVYLDLIGEAPVYR